MENQPEMAKATPKWALKKALVEISHFGSIAAPTKPRAKIQGR
jgi:hypothetical protein